MTIGSVVALVLVLHCCKVHLQSDSLRGEGKGERVGAAGVAVTPLDALSVPL